MKQFDYSRLRGKIKEVFNTQNDFADAMEIAPNTLSSKLNNQFYFSGDEISKAVELLRIESPEEAWMTFFTIKVDKKSTR